MLLCRQEAETQLSNADLKREIHAWAYSGFGLHPTPTTIMSNSVLTVFLLRRHKDPPMPELPHTQENEPYNPWRRIPT